MFIKRSYLILIGVVFIVLLALLLGNFLWEEKPEKIKNEAIKTESLRTEIVRNQIHAINQTFSGFVSSSKIQNVSFKISGKLEKGDVELKPGTHFNANDLLYKLNLKDAFYAISKKKIDLADKITTSLKELPSSIANEKNKWEEFAKEVSPAKRLPILPPLNSDSERRYFVEKGIMKDYKEISKMENDIENYFYLAPFDGFVIDVTSKLGSSIKAGNTIARIAKDNSSQLKITVPLSQNELFNVREKVVLFNSSGTKMGIGKLLRKEVKNENVNLVFSVKPENGQTIAFGTELSIVKKQAVEESFSLPRTALNGNSVTLIEKDRKLQREIIILKEYGDSVIVVGLKDGEEVVLK